MYDRPIWLKVTSQDIQASVHNYTVHQNQPLQIFSFWRGLLKWYQVLQSNIALESFTFYKVRGECISFPRALLFLLPTLYQSSHLTPHLPHGRPHHFKSSPHLSSCILRQQLMLLQLFLMKFQHKLFSMHCQVLLKCFYEWKMTG